MTLNYTEALRVLEMCFECTSITFIFHPEQQIPEIVIIVRKICYYQLA
jgi:hypothetical protein